MAVEGRAYTNFQLFTNFVQLFSQLTGLVFLLKAGVFIYYVRTSNAYGGRRS